VYELIKIKEKSEGYKSNTNKKIINQCNRLEMVLDDIYSSWNKAYSFLINNYDKKEISKIFSLGDE
jgi:hypothetical protein